MSREIKFRAWDKKEKIMVDWGVINQTAFNRGKNQLMYNILTNKLDVDVMQFTGLQDKNGVDIYEGDIDTEGYVFEFNTDMGGWYRMKNGEGFQWHAQALRKGRLPFEIAGNIYENLELLENKVTIT